MPSINAAQPSFEHPVSQLITATQFLEPAFKRWACQELGWQFGFNRKLWEYAYILNALEVHGKLGGAGLGFGVGRDPIVPVMLRHGARLVVTDLDDEEAQLHGWATMQVDSAGTDAVAFRFVNMNKIPGDLRDFDFLWSCGSLEHIGGLKQGLDFVENAMHCLRPGGIAVHTTEFTLSSNHKTFESPGLSFYRQRDIRDLAARLENSGYGIELNLTRGNHPLDGLVVPEPTPWELSLKAQLCGHTICSVGLIIRK
jgi:hypothetical protein